MPVTVRNTDILFNDGSTQSTAAGAVTTTAVLNATAAASVGAVGTYAFLGETLTTNTVPGGTRAGSGLRYAGSGSSAGWHQSANQTPQRHPNAYPNTPPGTWRCMGHAFGTPSGNYNNPVFPLCVWLRIS
jgi:hypothetical protein